MTNSNAAFERVRDEYIKRTAEEAKLASELPLDKVMAQRDEMLLEVGEEAAKLLASIIEGVGAKIIVELGTSYGYSTLFLAPAASRTGGRVYTYELSEGKQKYARTAKSRRT